MLLDPNFATLWTLGRWKIPPGLHMASASCTFPYQAAAARQVSGAFERNLRRRRSPLPAVCGRLTVPGGPQSAAQRAWLFERTTQSLPRPGAATMFRAITKKSANGHGADSKGTLTALWSKAGSKADNKEAPLSDAAPEGAAEPPSAQFTPAAASRASDEAAAAGQAAPPTTGGDVAIGAAPEPSPEPIAVAAQVAAEVQPPANPDAQPSKVGNSACAGSAARSARGPDGPHQLAAVGNSASWQWHIPTPLGAPCRAQPS